MHIFSSRFDFFRRSSFSGLTSPMTSSMHSDVQTPTYSSDMRILMENMQALNVDNRREDLLLTNSSSSKDKDSRLNSVRQYTPQSYRSNQSITESADVYK
jgi:hypothetical protein